MLYCWLLAWYAKGKQTACHLSIVMVIMRKMEADREKWQELSRMGNMNPMYFILLFSSSCNNILLLLMMITTSIDVDYFHIAVIIKDRNCLMLEKLLLDWSEGQWFDFLFSLTLALKDSSVWSKLKCSFFHFRWISINRKVISKKMINVKYFHGSVNQNF